MIRYYARLENTTANGGKCPRYTIVAAAGYYPPMEQIKGRDGLITMFLQEKLKEGDNVPAMRLQAAKSLNFTGLKEWFKPDGKLSGYAYGYPYDKPTFSKKETHNPFYPYRNDAFLFIVKAGEAGPIPTVPASFEMLVLENARPVAAACCKQLMMGGFDADLATLRMAAEGAII